MEYLKKGDFSCQKTNILHPHWDVKAKKLSGKKVQFKEKDHIYKQDKGIILDISLIKILESTFYSTSLKELKYFSSSYYFMINVK